LCKAAAEKVGLVSLNLSKNVITDLSCNIISDMLSKNYTIKELYLRWNKITKTGAEVLFNGMIFNESLKVFDIS